MRVGVALVKHLGLTISMHRNNVSSDRNLKLHKRAMTENQLQNKNPALLPVGSLMHILSPSWTPPCPPPSPGISSSSCLLVLYHHSPG
jgi:hypothetical protein